MKNLTIGKKFNALLYGGALISAIAVSGSVFFLSNQFVDQAMRDKLERVRSEFASELAASQRAATMMAILVGEQASVKQAMAAGDRDSLAGEFVGPFESIKSQYDVRQFQFHVPPATSFLRVHKVEKFGDDLSGFRKTVLAANNESRVVNGLEAGVAGIGIRGVAPIRDGDKHLGTVEFGLSLHQGFVDEFTDGTGYQTAIYALRENGAEVIGSTIEIDTDIAALLPESAEAAAEEVTYVSLPGTDNRYAGTVFPVRDFSGNVIGSAVIAVDRTSYNAIAAKGQLAAAGLFLLLILISTGISFAMRMNVIRPLVSITGSMEKIARGEHGTKVPFVGRGDEIGSMASALDVFRTSLLRNVELEQEAESNRKLSERERARQEEERTRRAAELQQAIDGLGQGLARLAAGDTTQRIETPFAGKLDELRQHYNETVDSLKEALSTIAGSSDRIRARTDEVNGSADELSARTEKQASAIEETAAALEEIAATVKIAHQNADEIGRMVAEATGLTTQSREVVSEAVEAMSSIEKSSQEMTQIISTIEEIAFQTNLLALNAGVEAARAGEAGSGFAVVAQEVRELAQRSAAAVGEIEALIESSNRFVRQGADLVRRTGDALSQIGEHVTNINTNVTSLVQSSSEQSSSVNEVNEAVRQMDRVTQQNAAMAEETTASVHALLEEIGELNAAMARFRTEVATAAGDESARGRAAA
ncbi:methyl-accepting chemotaxis protein [Oricola thermophila]|uniref:HAMP domain-containing protein n=1 Tax=Oricola thermophila TaxID=2742145 RepID=A0A6N1VE30_9HYPH|nr:methyl-accepting chemotaxis protein [Oricola thermophila]QKV19190.1 HAMP domain-containing protein [Oricola thermophila]